MITYGNKTENVQTSYGQPIDGLLTKGYDALGNSGLLTGMNGYGGGIAPKTRNTSYGNNMAYALAEAQHGKGFSDQIRGAGGGYGPNQISMQSAITGMQPFVDTIGRQRVGEIDRAYDEARAQSRASAANGVAFGGSGAAIREGQLARGEAQAREAAISGVLTDALNQSLGIEGANAASANRASEFGLTQGLNSEIAANSAYNDMIDRDQSMINGLLTSGASDQAFQQALLDLPWTNWQRFMSALPAPGSTQTTNKPMTFDPISLLLGMFS
jgi:hypothetical protein